MESSFEVRAYIVAFTREHGHLWPDGVARWHVVERALPHFTELEVQRAIVALMEALWWHQVQLRHAVPR
jgi:hypothetical protein